MNKKELLFPHSEIRESQGDLIKDIVDAVENKKHIIAHAPTGLGKTSASLGPCLAYALKNNLTVFFLTSRHTQHKIAIDTIKEIRNTFGQKVRVVDIIGKKWMCPVPGIDALYSNEFSEYCKDMRENDKCEFYTNTKEGTKLSVVAKTVLKQVEFNVPDCDEMINTCRSEKICPYEMSIELARKANVVIADYYYIFNPKISKLFLTKTNKKIEDSIVIIDEAHNLPNRVRDLATERLTSIMVKRAIKEAKKHGYKETIQFLVIVQDALNEISKGMNVYDQKLVNKDLFINLIEKHIGYTQLFEDLLYISEFVKEKQKQSYIGGIARFLAAWKGPDKGFTRIINRHHGKEEITTLSYRCLDPSVITSDIIKEAHSCIFMSGTLTPTLMYKDLLGIEDDRCITKEYENPFPDHNRINLVIPKTTTKYSMRNTEQYKRIAGVCAELTNNIKGNSIIFFPSYYLRDFVYEFFNKNSTKTLFLEKSGMAKNEKEELLERFKEYKKTGAVLLGVTSGSYGEGVDLPGDLLKCVIVVGLPLNQPNLETKELIKYFDDKFGKGWDYGYLFPAFNRTLQSAGRCIRSETDRGIVVFLDERYVWPNYRKCFPKDWEMVVSTDPLDMICDFFDRKSYQ